MSENWTFQNQTFLGVRKLDKSGFTVFLTQMPDFLFDFFNNGTTLLRKLDGNKTSKVVPLTPTYLRLEKFCTF